MPKQTRKRQLICVSVSLIAIVLLTVSFLVTVVPKGYGQNEYKAWAKEHGILLFGTSQDSRALYDDGFDEGLTVDPATVNGFGATMEALMLLPDYLLVAMEPQYNSHTEIVETKAIYFSTKFDPKPGYAIIMPRNYGDVLRDCHTGFVLEQELTGPQALHEFGHIVDFCGITCPYYWEGIWEDLADLRNQIFDAEGDLMSDYANTNPAEDFAVHFDRYVSKGPIFRAKAQLNVDLQERYDFLKQYLFNGLEYEGGTLEGLVIDEQGVGIPDADVCAMRLSDLRRLKLATTDGSGGFCARNLEWGEYVVWAEKWGYVTVGLPQSVYMFEGETEITIPVTKIDISIPPIPTDQSYMIVIGLVCVAIAFYWVKRKT